ncbi:hypothetical protein HIM_05828 [Hirsutella minnesotensis 3608]|uniref:FAD-binding PCMH-type domain-containing protein n=1 Tax=Hirsutella minnesotensis 3608 TaxID=1043627 RepID=A0A0F7ZJV4_9HYPO|nr:hypothetical protein HIM_05828 [Hirsutella minnesotensis 3608]
MLHSVAAALVLLAGFAPTLTSARQPLPDGNGDCKCFPGDECWPGPEAWAKLNSTVAGRLIETVPLASPCHDPDYDEAKCSAIREQWTWPRVHMESSSSIMMNIFTNGSCEPFQPRSSPCLLGNYVRYAVDVAGPGDVIAALQFAEDHNLRFVIRNTGHDLIGRSTGAGALAIWTHHLKSIQVVDWHDERHRGKALKLGAGVQGLDALEAARREGLVVVTGHCPSVGIAGGYTQGAGHSMLSTAFGLAADNTLEFQVITPSGQLVTASPSSHSDLFWALNGGGGGNYGVVVSMTVKAHPDAVTSGASFELIVPEANRERLVQAVDALHAALPEMVDSGIALAYSFNETSLILMGLTAFNKTMDHVQEAIKPLQDAVADIGLALDIRFTEFSNFFDHHIHYTGSPPDHFMPINVELLGGRLLPRKVASRLSGTWRKLVAMGVTVLSGGLDVSRFGADGTNAVLPQWRESVANLCLILPWSFEKPFEVMAAEQDRITREIQPVIEAATPGAGAYMNEADFQQPDFQETFYGANYPRLLEVKRRYDPRSTLYVRTGVGSEDWTARQDGRLCRSIQRTIAAGRG